MTIGRHDARYGDDAAFGGSGSRGHPFQKEVHPRIEVARHVFRDLCISRGLPMTASSLPKFYKRHMKDYGVRYLSDSYQYVGSGMRLGTKTYQEGIE